MRSKTVRIAALALGIALLLVTALSGLATAEPRHLLVTLLGGKQVSITVDAAPGTPAGSIPLPDLGGPVVGVSEIGAPPAAPATTAATTTAATATGTTVTGPPTTIAPTTGSTPATTTTTGPAAIGGIVKPKGQPQGEGRDAAVVAPTTTQSSGQPALADANGSTTPASPGDGAAPTPATPGFTVAPAGPAIVGVPNFFIENFRIPPFLLPIYQAAGIQYSVPWQVLAAINEIETDYGRNLSVSSAGALGWMQFMPSSWAMYGVDANGDGVKDPYNPVDAIFAAARYLKAAGADADLSRAIFAYNHADWYVQSVLLRARVIGGMPADLVGSLTGLTQGHFPVAARATYADGLDAKAATRPVQGTNAAVPVEGNPSRRSINIFARAGAPAIAVNDGRVAKLGKNARLGRFVVLQDVYGNRYTYSHLGSLASRYPVPKPHAQDATAPDELEPPKADAKPTVSATAGAQKPAGTARGSGASGKRRAAAKAPHAGAADAPAATKERLFAHPERPAAYASGGQRQLAELGQPLESFDGYFTEALALDPHDYLLKPLQRGSSVIAGTILGRVGKTAPALAPHVEFAIRPAGRGAPQIDPKPILDGWKLLESTAIYRANGKNAFAAANASGPSIGQIMLMSKEQLQRSVLADPRLTLYECGRQDVATGEIDRRVLATLEFLSASGFKLTISALKCGHSYYTTSGNVSEHSSGNAVDIAAVNGIPIAGHQGAGSITDITIRRLLTLQGTMKPHQIISLMTYPGTDNTLALPDHADHIHVGFHPVGDLLGNQRLQAILKPQQWTKLVEQLGSIENPVVATHASKYALKDGHGD
jgi:Transglycosylase SLT domain